MPKNSGTTECCECHREFRGHAGNHTCCPDCQHERRIRQIRESWHKKKSAKGHTVKSKTGKQASEYTQRAGMTRFSRKCHRCGRPTNDFECPDCQQYRRAQGY